jgi:hypothetical protein
VRSGIGAPSRNCNQVPTTDMIDAECRVRIVRSAVKSKFAIWRKGGAFVGRHDGWESSRRHTQKHRSLELIDRISCAPSNARWRPYFVVSYPRIPHKRRCCLQGITTFFVSFCFVFRFCPAVVKYSLRCVAAIFLEHNKQRVGVHSYFFLQIYTS